jgi:hypothetical protein
MGVAGAVLLLLVLRRTIGDGQAASLLTSIILILFFSYGHVSGLLHLNTSGIFFRLGLDGQPVYLISAWLLIFAGASFVVYRVGELRRYITQAFSLMAAVALAVPLGQIVIHEIQLSKPWPEEQVHFSHEAAPADEIPPDIYLLVLDGYGRADILRDIYNFDNSTFLGRLESLGFRVAEEARSNYTQTRFSLASMLNMTYLDALSPSIPQDSDDRAAISRLIRWSEIRRILEEQGYTIVGMPSGYRPTELENADVFQREPLRAATTLERWAFETSALVILQDMAVSLGRPPLQLGYRAHRDRINFVLEQLNEVRKIPGPKLVFVHLLIPHPPFVFDATGDPVAQRYPFILGDGDDFFGTREEYVRGYRDQISYVNQVVLEAIVNLLQTSTHPPVIVIHGDHGPGSRLNWQSPEDSDLLERSAILSAYYLPDAPEEVVYDTITPVNTFRAVLDLYFDTDLGLLPDQSFHSTHEQPYFFIQIND